MAQNLSVEHHIELGLDRRHHPATGPFLEGPRLAAEDTAFLRSDVGPVPTEDPEVTPRIVLPLWNALFILQEQHSRLKLQLLLLVFLE